MKRKIWWFNLEGKNTGDIFTPWLFEQMGIPYEFSEGREFIGCGSVFNFAKPNSFVWGAGIHRASDKIPKCYKILAVRGKLTRDLLKMPDLVLGDPGLLLSKFYKPNVSKKHKVCILSHWTDYSYFKQFENFCPVYNMRQDSLDKPIEYIADRICECDMVFSSSLHGIIFAHSLGVPAIHIENKMLYSTDNFKFKDYYSTIGLNYFKEKFVPTNEFVDTYLLNKDRYLPKMNLIRKIQEDLMKVFPYEVSRNKAEDR